MRIGTCSAQLPLSFPPPPCPSASSDLCLCHGPFAVKVKCGLFYIKRCFFTLKMLFILLLHLWDAHGLSAVAIVMFWFRSHFKYKPFPTCLCSQTLFSCPSKLPRGDCAVVFSCSPLQLPLTRLN